jgi:hypothetical protein
MALQRKAVVPVMFHVELKAKDKVVAKIKKCVIELTHCCKLRLRNTGKPPGADC